MEDDDAEDDNDEKDFLKSLKYILRLLIVMPPAQVYTQ